MQKSLGKKLISEAFLRELRLLSQPRVSVGIIHIEGECMNNKYEAIHKYSDECSNA